MSIAKEITHTQVEAVDYAPRTKAEVHARAERHMRSGKRLVISGFVVAVLGIVAYCFVGLSAGVNQQTGSAFLESAGWLTGATLGIVGLGTLLWLVGSVLYVSGGMDSDPDGPDLYF
jgi:hypothetical protein